MDSVIQALLKQDAWEWIGMLTGLMYVILAVYEKPLCWIFGIISSLCLAVKSFVDYKLIADGVLQLFYIGMGFWGLFQWWRGMKSEEQSKIISKPLLTHLMGIVISLLISIPLSWLLIQYAGARYGYLDVALMLLSLWTTWLLIQKERYQWLYWVIIDAVYVFLYWKTQAWLFALLFLVYTFIAAWGHFTWQRQFLKTNS